MEVETLLIGTGRCPRTLLPSPDPLPSTALVFYSLTIIPQALWDFNLGNQSVTEILIPTRDLDTFLHQGMASEKLNVLLDAVDDDLFVVLLVASADEGQLANGLAMWQSRLTILSTS